jgi:hypothetical protein
MQTKVGIMVGLGLWYYKGVVNMDNMDETIIACSKMHWQGWITAQ